MKKLNKKPDLFLKFGFLILCFLIVSCIQGYAQIVIKGTIRDNSYNPLIGASVIVKGTNKGVITDFDGNFTINVKDTNATMIISYIGYLTQEIPLKGQANIDVVLQEDIKGFEELVVIGYGVQKKRDLTGSVASVNEERIRDIPVTNLEGALQGSVAGVSISTYKGSPGSGSNILIRGVKSLKATNSPLVVIDGIPGGSINDIHPDDIKSIEVLKDASATAIYGARGTNGVILITTNTGKIGKPVITYNMSYGFSYVAKKVDVLSAEEYVAKKREIYRMQNSRYNRRDTTFEIMSYEDAQNIAIEDILAGNELEMYNMGKSYNWLEEITQRAPIQSHNLSLSGGNNKTQYFLSASMVDQTGIIQKSGYNKQAVRVNVASKVTDWFKVGTNVLVNHSKQENVPFGIFTSTYQLSPLGAKYENEHNPDSGDYELYPMYPDEFITNPFTEIEIKDVVTRTKLLNSTFLEFSFIPELTYRMTVNTVLDYEKEDYFVPTRTKQVLAFDKVNNASIEYVDRLNLNMEHLLSYNKKFGGHQITGTFVFTTEDYRRDRLWAKSRGYGSDYYEWTALQLGDPTAFEVESLEERTYLISYIGRINYNYKGKYLLQLSLRNDRSSKFSEENRDAIFPGGSVGWRISDEPFMNNLAFLNDLKLRVSYATTGNEGIGYRDRFNIGDKVYYTTGQDGAGQIVEGLEQVSLANKDLKWEKSTQLNTGLDFTLFNGKLSGVIEYYNTLTTDLLWDRTISSITGYTSIRDNIGSVQNNGIEVTLNNEIIKTNDFSLGAIMTFSANKNKIIDLDGSKEDFVNDRLFIGEPIGVVYDYVFNGVLQEGETAPIYQPLLLPGEVKVRDAGSFITLEDGTVTTDIANISDSIINEADMQIIGQIHPKWFGSFGLNFSYKNLSISVFINHVHGTTRRIPINVSDRPHSMDIPYYTDENPNSQYGRPAWPALGRIGNQYEYLSYYVDGSYTRLQDVTIAYEIKSPLLEKAGISSIRPYFTGQNLFTISDYIGYDPAFEYTSNQTGGRIDRVQEYPTIKNLIFGLKATF
ncbi:MAG: TonB-dependent receptor [Bacteroidales bacterium]|nr:TonB-dependent receptor [Bacteroidales bacterium]